MRFYSGMRNSQYLLLATGMLTFLFLTLIAAAAPMPQSGKYLFYVGTYTE